MSVRWKRWLYPVVVVGVGAGIGGFLISNPSSSLAYAEQSIVVDPLADAPTVATIAPQRGDYAPQIQLYGQLRSTQQVKIDSPVAAQVTQVLVNEGDVVAEGAVLVQLDTKRLSRQVDQLQARRLDLVARRSAQAQQTDNDKQALVVEESLVDIARRSVARLTDLKAKNLTSASELENAERNLQTQLLSLQNRKLAIARFVTTDQQFEAQLIELDSQIDQAQEQLADATITAPFKATVSQVEVQVGASAQNGQTLMTLVNQEKQELVAWVAANALSNVQSKMLLQGQLEADTRSIPVSLLHTDPSANAGSLRLFFATDVPAPSLTLNRYYRMWINLPVQETVAVPESAVYSNRFVYQVVENRLNRIEISVVGERFEGGQLWRLIRGPLTDDPVLVTRLQNAAQGLAVRTASTTDLLAAAE